MTMSDRRRCAAPPRGASIAALLLGLCILLAAGPARGKPAPPAPWDLGVTPEQQTLARQLFRDATTHHYAGLFGQAAEEYRRAVQAWPHPIIHYNLALAQIALDQLVEADEHLEKALEHGLDGLAGDLQKFEYATQKRAALGRRLATVAVTCRIAGARVSIDKEYVFTVEHGMPRTVKRRIRVDPQAVHQFSAELPDGEVVIVRRAIGPGETVPIAVEEQLEHRRPWKAMTWQPWAVLAVGVQLGVAGGVLEWSAQRRYEKHDRAVAQCPTCDPKAFAPLRERGDLQRTLGIVSYGLAGVALVTGGLAAYLNRPVARRIKHDSRARKQLSLSPLVAPDGGGALVMGSF